MHANGFDAVLLARLRQIACCAITKEGARICAASEVKVDTLHLRTQVQLGHFLCDCADAHADANAVVPLVDETASVDACGDPGSAVEGMSSSTR